MLLLRVHAKGEFLRDLRIQQPETVLGRDPESGLPLADPRVSRRHAVIRREPDGYRLLDLETAGRTLHNGLAVPSPGPGVLLLPGDEIRIGEFRIEVAAWDPATPDGTSPEGPFVCEREAARILHSTEADLARLTGEGRVATRTVEGRTLYRKADVEVLRDVLQADSTRRLTRYPSPEEDGMVPLDDLASLFGIPPAEAEALALRSGLSLLTGPRGAPAVRRRDLADRLLRNPAPALLVEPRPPWTRGESAGEPAAPLEEEEPEEEATEETSERSAGSETEPLRGIVTVLYYDRMTPGRSFPLLVQGTRITAPVRAVPRLPGCLCVPSGEDLAPDAPRAEFWVSPQAVGPAPSASVEILGCGVKVAEVRTPFLVRRLTPSWALLGIAGLSLAMAVVFEAFPPVVGKASLLARGLAAAGGAASACLLLSAAAFAAGAAWFFLANPRESKAAAVSLTGRPPDGKERG